MIPDTSTQSGRMLVLVGRSFRRGSDIIKALAMGPKPLVGPICGASGPSGILSSIIPAPDERTGMHKVSRFALPRGLRGVEQLQILLVDGHVLAEGDCCGLGADQMHRAPGLARGVKLFDNRLVVLERVHLGEIVVAHDPGEKATASLSFSGMIPPVCHGVSDEPFYRI
jgi:hypothetical protein